MRKALRSGPRSLAAVANARRHDSKCIVIIVNRDTQLPQVVQAGGAFRGHLGITQRRQQQRRQNRNNGDNDQQLNQRKAVMLFPHRAGAGVRAISGSHIFETSL